MGFTVSQEWRELLISLFNSERKSESQSILADRTAAQYDRLLASSCRPSVCL